MRPFISRSEGLNSGDRRELSFLCFLYSTDRLFDRNCLFDSSFFLSQTDKVGCGVGVILAWAERHGWMGQQFVWEVLFFSFFVAKLHTVLINEPGKGVWTTIMDDHCMHL